MCGGDVTFRTVRAFGSECSPGRSTYGMEGTPDMEQLERLVLAMTLDDGSLEISDWEPLTHSVLNVTLDGRPMQGIPDPEPLEHSVLVMALDSGLMEGMSHLEPL